MQPKYVQICQHDLYGHMPKMNWQTNKLEKRGVIPDFHFYEELVAMKIPHMAHKEMPAVIDLGNVLLKVADNGLLMEVGANYDTSD